MLWLFVPGLATGLAGRMRGLALWAVAPALSTATLAVLAVVFAVVGVRWDPLPAALGVLAAALIVWALRLSLHPAPAQGVDERSWERWLLPAGIAVGAVLTVTRLALYIGAPDNVSQTNDAVFHLNALRYIAETGSASSLDLTGMLGAVSVYPAAWHAPASLVFLMGSDIVVVANAMSLVIGAVWTLGTAWLTLVATRGDRLAAAAAALLSGALAAFPLLMIQWGVLYPSLLAIAILPAALASMMVIPAGWSSGGLRGAVLPVVFAGAAVVGVALAQPSILVVWGIGVASWVMWRLAPRWKGAVGRVRLMLALAELAVLLALAGLWWYLGRFVTAEWPPSRSKLEAVFEVASNGLVGFPAAWVVSALMLVGLVRSVREPSLRWIAAAWAAVAVLYIVAASIGNPTVRGLLLAPFYGDPYRVAAAVPVFVIPLAGIGAAAIGTFVVQAIRRRTGEGDPSVPAVAGWALAMMAVFGVLGLIVAPVIQWRDVWSGAVDRVTWYTMADGSYLTPDERVLLDRLNESVPEGELVIGNPSTGMAFGFALGDHLVYPLTWAPPRTGDYDILADRLNEASTDPDVCPAVRSIGARYVLDFGAGETQYGRYLLPGFTDISPDGGFELVDSEGDAQLWRITACE